MRYLVGERIETDYRPFGVDITKILVYGSALGDDVTPERVMMNLARPVTGGDIDKTDCDDTGYIIEQLCISEPTTRRQVMDEVAATVDWNYGFEENRTFFFRRPFGAGDVPDSQLIVVSSADPALREWDVRVDRRELCNRVVAYVRTKDGHANCYIASEPDGPLGTHYQTKFLDLRDRTANDAQQIVDAYLADHLWPRPTGTLVLTGPVHLADGSTIEALHIRPGMMLQNVDTDFGPQMIEHVTGRLAAREVTLTLGQRSSRFDRMLARQQLQARKRPKGKK